MPALAGSRPLDREVAGSRLVGKRDPLDSRRQPVAFEVLGEPVGVRGFGFERDDPAVVESLRCETGVGTHVGPDVEDQVVRPEVVDEPADDGTFVHHVPLHEPAVLLGVADCELDLAVPDRDLVRVDQPAMDCGLQPPEHAGFVRPNSTGSGRCSTGRHGPLSVIIVVQGRSNAENTFRSPTGRPTASSKSAFLPDPVAEPVRRSCPHPQTLNSITGRNVTTMQHADGVSR